MFLKVDETDMESWPFCPDWYGHELHGAAFRYAVCVSVSTGHLVWTTGPYPCGLFSDIEIFNIR